MLLVTASTSLLKVSQSFSTVTCSIQNIHCVVSTLTINLWFFIGDYEFTTIAVENNTSKKRIFLRLGSDWFLLNICFIYVTYRFTFILSQVTCFVAGGTTPPPNVDAILMYVYSAAGILSLVVIVIVISIISMRGCKGEMI